jgi:hypothetical protein
MKATAPRYLCSVSGLSTDALPDEVMAVVPVEDPLEDLPLGWSRVTIETRMENPRYLLFLEARETLIQQGLAATVEGGVEVTEKERAMVEMLVDGQLSGMAVAPFSVLAEELFVHPQYLSHLTDALGLEAEEEEEEEEEEPVVEAAPIPDNGGVEPVAAEG